MVFHAIPDANHGNPIGITHGGFAATLLDSAMSCAVHTTLGAGGRVLATGVATCMIMERP
jgi:acyl-coenzyme A thioesterase PaaI-like protein